MEAVDRDEKNQNDISEDRSPAFDLLYKSILRMKQKQAQQMYLNLDALKKCHTEISNMVEKKRKKFKTG